MRTVDLGNVRGPRGTRWFVGNGLTGELDAGELTSPIETDAILGDLYINSETGEYYECVTGGQSDESRWSYRGSIIGAPGASPSISVGTVSSGEQASAAISGESPNLVLNLVLPKGDRGEAFSFTEKGTYAGLLAAYPSGSEAYASLAPDFAYLVISGEHAGYAFFKDESSQDGFSSFAYTGEKGDTGDAGVSITSATAVQSDEDGGENVVMLHFSNGSSNTFTVRNGRKGDKMSYDDLTAAQKDDLRGPTVSGVSVVQSPEDDGVNTVSILMSDGDTLGGFEVRNGSRGSVWHCGTLLSSDGSDIQVQTSLFDTTPRPTDFYLNRESSKFYICSSVSSGMSSWNYVGSLKGIQGNAGVAFDESVLGDATFVDTLSQRSQYDSQSDGFMVFVTDIQTLYVKTPDGWSDGITFKGEKGDTGDTYVPMVSDDGVLTWRVNGVYADSIPPVNLRTAGANVVVSPYAPTSPYQGMIWVSDNDEYVGSVGGLSVMSSGERPDIAPEGTIWIK